MSGKKPSLGRGLAELSPLLAKRAGAPAYEPPVLAGDRLASLPLDLLQRGKYQPRVDMRAESLSELADSIKSRGLVQPILVRPLPRPNPTESQRYEIIAGERRWRAAQMAGLTEVPVIVRQADDRAVLEMALIENLQRENLIAIEEAQGYAQLIGQFQLTQEEAAHKVGKSRAAVANSIRLLELHSQIQTWVGQGRVSVGHAKVLLGLKAPEEQLLVAETILRRSATSSTSASIRIV